MTDPTSPPPVDVKPQVCKWLVERLIRYLVEFEFSISDPALFVEMLLPEAAYEEFLPDQPGDPVGRHLTRVG